MGHIINPKLYRLGVVFYWDTLLFVNKLFFDYVTVSNYYVIEYLKNYFKKYPWTTRWKLFFHTLSLVQVHKSINIFLCLKKGGIQVSNINWVYRVALNNDTFFLYLRMRALFKANLLYFFKYKKLIYKNYNSNFIFDLSRWKNKFLLYLWKKKLKKYKKFFNKKSAFLRNKNYISLKNNWFKFSYNFKKLFNKYNINFVWFTGFENYFLSSIFLLQLYWIKLKIKKFNYRALTPPILLRQYYYLTFFNIEYNFMINKYLNKFKKNKYLTALFVKKNFFLQKKYFLILQNFLKIYFFFSKTSGSIKPHKELLFLYKKFMFKFKLTDLDYISNFIKLLNKKLQVRNISSLFYLQEYIYNFFFEELPGLQNIRNAYEKKFKIKDRSNIFFNLNRIVLEKRHPFDDGNAVDSQVELIDEFAEDIDQKYFIEDDFLDNKKKNDKPLKKKIVRKVELTKLDNNSGDMTKGLRGFNSLSHLLKNYSHINSSWLNNILKYNLSSLNKKINLKFLIWKKFIFKKKLSLDIKVKKFSPLLPLKYSEVLKRVKNIRIRFFFSWIRKKILDRLLSSKVKVKPKVLRKLKLIEKTWKKDYLKFNFFDLIKKRYIRRLNNIKYLKINIKRNKNYKIYRFKNWKNFKKNSYRWSFYPLKAKFLMRWFGKKLLDSAVIEHGNNQRWRYKRLFFYSKYKKYFFLGRYYYKHLKKFSVNSIKYNFFYNIIRKKTIKRPTKKKNYLNLDD